MERTKKSGKAIPPPTPKPRLKWLNTGGTFRMASGKIIKPQERFLAYLDEIPAAFRDVIKPIDPLPAEPIPVPVGGYELKEKTGGLFDIVDDNGKTLNEKPLRQDEATEILEKLE